MDFQPSLLPWLFPLIVSLGSHVESVPARAEPASTTTATPPTVTITAVSITSSGSNTAGESYTLECTVTVTVSDLPVTITWMGPMDNNITSGVYVVTTGSMSTLTFNPLAASHAGTYTCRAALGSAMDSASRTITVQSE